MIHYEPPVRDYCFLLTDALSTPETRAVFEAAQLDGQLIETLLGEAGELCATKLLPINRTGDQTGCVLVEGAVRTPAGFREAYQAYCHAGWPGLACKLEHGGQALPQCLEFALYEMLASANMAFSNYPGLSRGAYKLLAAHAAGLSSVFLENLATGAWSGTMCMTEPQSGTDVGLIRTRAIPDGGGSYQVSGQKIFVTSGEHDLSDNILHLVLARLPDAPPGTKGLSLFLVPKYLVIQTEQRARETPCVAFRSSTRWACTGPPPACSPSKMQRDTWWENRTLGCARCSP